VTAGLFYRTNSEIDAIVEVGSSAFVHTIAHPDEEESDEDETMNLMQEALAYVTAKCEQKCGANGKTVRFDGVEIPPSMCPRPQPALKQAMVEDEIISPEVQALSSKGKGLKVMKIAPHHVPVTNNSTERTTLAPKALYLHPHNQPHHLPIILHHHYPCLRYLRLLHNQLLIATHSH